MSMNNINIKGVEYPFPNTINMAIMKEWELANDLKYSDINMNDLTHTTTLFYLCIQDECDARGVELNITQKQFDRMMDTETMVKVAKTLSKSFVPSVESSVESDEAEVGNLQKAIKG